MKVISTISKSGFKTGGACPLCGARKLGRAVFCACCRRSGRLHFDPGEIGRRRRKVFIPREPMR